MVKDRVKDVEKPKEEPKKEEKPKRIEKAPEVRNLVRIAETDIAKLEEMLTNPAKHGVPNYFLNRRKDMKTGQDMHLIGSDLDVAHKFDVQDYINLKTYRGIRHMLGQPVRGQRTRSSFRQKGRVVGVMKKPIKLEAKAEEKKEEKK